MSPAIRKRDLGGGIAHPAPYSANIVPTFARLLDEYIPVIPRPYWVLDPFSGIGGIHDLQWYVTIGGEREYEWARLRGPTVVSDATCLPFPDRSFDVIATSPCYGNRMADSYNSSDPETRHSYHFDLGRKLSANNAGAMQWGRKDRAYERLHEAAWAEASRVLRPGGIFLLNIKDHRRNWVWQQVPKWHVETIVALGFDLLHHCTVETPGMRQGANSDARAPEQIFVLRKE